MLWLTIALVAYLFGAVTHLFDKYLLKKKESDPGVLTFYIGILGVVALILAPWGLRWVGWINFFVALLTGFIFLAAILFFFYALNKANVSKVAPLVGGLTPVFVLTLGFIFKKEGLTSWQTIAFCLIVTGSFLISLESKRGRLLIKDAVFLSIFSALLFSASHLLAQTVYQQQGFINGFIYARAGGVLGALLLLFSPAIKKGVWQDYRQPRAEKATVFLAGQTCGALNFILYNYAFTLGPLALISALQGVQYVFLFLMVLLFSWKWPRVLKEKMTTPILLQKTASVILIAAGVGVLAFWN